MMSLKSTTVMARLSRIIIIVVLTAGALIVSAATKQASGLLQEGLFVEEVEGDLDAAIEIYQRIIDEATAGRSDVAQAMYRQGNCYLKKQREQQAKAVFARLVAEYSDQTAVVNKVKPLMEELGNADPRTAGAGGGRDRPPQPQGGSLAAEDAPNEDVRKLAVNETTNQAGWQALELNEISEIKGFLVELGYLPTKDADANAYKKALQRFAESHFEGDVAAFRSAEALKKHLSYAAAVYRFRKEGDSSVSTVSVLAQYRVGISAYGCIPYVIGGCSASLSTSVRDILNNKFIPSIYQRLAPGKEIQIHIIDAEGNGHVTDIVDAPADPEVAMFFWSKKMSRLPIAGQVHVVPSPSVPSPSGPAPIYRIFDKELVRILDIKGDEITIVGQFVALSQLLYERTMKVTENMDIVVCESENGATKEGPHITFKEFRNMFIPWEAALISGDDLEGCNKLYIYRPASVIVEGQGPRILDTAIAAAYREGSSHALTLEQIKTIAASCVCPPETTGAQRQDLLLTLAIAVRLLPSNMKVSLTEIQPDASGDPLILVPGEKASSTEELEVKFDKGKLEGLSKVTNVGGIVMPPGSSRLADGFIMTKGDSLMGVGTRHMNVRSFLIVRKISEFASCVLSTELPKETVPYSLGDEHGLISSPNVVIPNGEGSILRFRGVVKDFFKGWTIQGDDGEPLSFVLLRDEGLTYIFGKGSVLGPDNRRYEFTGPSRIKR
jgi:tetratricopeptide (TPR) repeat protein